MRLDRVRRELERYVRSQMIEQDALLQDVDLLHGEPMCPLINPACPGDDCILPAGHVGTEEQIHILGTDNFAYAERYHDFPMAEVGATHEDIYQLALIEAKKRWPPHGRG